MADTDEQTGPGSHAGPGAPGGRSRPYARDVALLGRSTPQRSEILEALAARPDFASAQALHHAMQTAGTQTGLSTVYRVLAALTKAGRTEVVRDSKGERLYRYRPDADHAHYLLCRRCGRSLPLDAGPVEAWAELIARSYGFAEVQHTVELTGTCTTCTAAESAAG
ncbi:transcriptional repressor [Streptacidiphilus sp. 4-A2]|nr:transcriptional repressor [Streptacidiphilus sp. 4-A2]